jgi:hypothetical protein
VEEKKLVFCSVLLPCQSLLIEERTSIGRWQTCSQFWVCYHVRIRQAAWPSGLRRRFKAPVRKGVSSNLTAVTTFCSALESLIKILRGRESTSDLLSFSEKWVPLIASCIPHTVSFAIRNEWWIVIVLSSFIVPNEKELSLPKTWIRSSQKRTSWNDSDRSNQSVYRWLIRLSYHENVYINTPDSPLTESVLIVTPTAAEVSLIFFLSFWATV